MSRKYYYFLFIALCLTGSVLKLRVTWQPSTLPVKPTAMSWIVDASRNRKDFMPSEEGFIEFGRKRVKRNSGSIDRIESESSVNSILYNPEDNLISKTLAPLVLQPIEYYSGSGSGHLELTGDYSGSGEEDPIIELLNKVSYEPLDFKDVSGSGDILLSGEGSASEEESGAILNDFRHNQGRNDSEVTSLIESSGENMGLTTTTSFYPSEQFEYSTLIVQSSSPPVSEESTNRTKEVIFSTRETFTVRFQEGRIQAVNTTTEVTVVEPLSCVSDSECDGVRNQRCVDKGGVSVCDCGRSFILNPETRRCEVKVSLVGRLRCPKESYQVDLNYRGSLQYNQTKENAKVALLLIFEKCNCLNLPGAHLEVTALHSGSLLIDWQLTFPASRHGIIQNQFVTSLHKSIDFILQTQQPLLSKSPIDLRDSELVYINGVNPCDGHEQNYCDTHAQCLISNGTAGGYICRCNEGYQDLSPDLKLYPGEFCQEMCDKGYCGRNGNCSIVNNKPICRCNGWYSGKYCQVSIVVLAASVGCVLVLFLAISIPCGRYCYNKRKGTFGSFKLKGNAISNSKAKEEIALATNKYVEAIRV